MQLLLEKIRQPLSNLNFNLNIELKLFESSDHLHTFFSSFRIQCYIFLLFCPIGLAAPAYLTSSSFEVISVGISIGLFLLGLFLLLPWTLVPLLFLFTNFGPTTLQRKLSWVYVCLLVISFIIWLFIF